MPSTNDDIIAEYAGVRRALMTAKHTKPPTGAINRTIAQLERYLQRPLRVVVLGEHNSGKTALINAMLGREMLPTAVIANTPVSVTMRYGTTAAIRAQTNCGTWHDIDRDHPLDDLDAQSLRTVEVRAPNPLLKQFELVDTPPTEDPGSNVQGADLVIWCTNATRAWSETERRAWAALPRRCRRYGILAATHMESLVAVSDREKVLDRLHTEAGELFDDIKLVDSATYPGTGASASVSTPHDTNGIKALLQHLVKISSKQKQRRTIAAHKIANRLASAFPTARKFHEPPPLSMDIQLVT